MWLKFKIFSRAKLEMDKRCACKRNNGRHCENRKLKSASYFNQDYISSSFRAIMPFGNYLKSKNAGGGN